MTLKTRINALEAARQGSAGYTVICTGDGAQGPLSWAEVNGQRIDRRPDETDAAFLDRAAALGEPFAEIIHLHGALPTVDVPHAPTLDEGAGA